MISAPISVPKTLAWPPVNGVPPDRDRRDGVELHAEADLIGVARRIDRNDDQTGDPGAQAADRIDPSLDRGRPERREPRRPLVAADRQDLAAEQRAPQRPGGAGDQGQHEMTWNGTPKMRPRPMNWNVGLWNGCRLPLVITCPMPRPAMNMTSVPTIG